MIDPRSVDHIHYEHQCRYNRLAEKLEMVTKERDAAADYASDQAAVIELVAKALGVPDEPHQGRAEGVLEAASSLAEERDALASHCYNYRQAVFHFNRSHGDINPLLLLMAEEPQTSLARRDLLKQAEGAAMVAESAWSRKHLKPFGITPQECAANLATIIGNDLRRQAEEGHHAE